MMSMVELLGKIKHLCNELLEKKLFLGIFGKKFTFVNRVTFYFSTLYKGFRILKLGEV